VTQNPKSSQATVIHTLVVVGDILLQAAIERQLQQVGHAAAVAGSVPEAIDRLRREPFDVVLCELHPSGSEGTELLHYMSSYYPSTPVVVICEALNPEFRGQYEGGGSVRIVEKPIDLRKLVEMIEACGPKKGFFGNQIEVEFFDYVQMVAISGRDKALIVTTRAGTGYIWFEHGDIVHAQYGEHRGEQAFYRLLAVGRGTYREVLFRPPPARTIVRPSMHLLMEAARQQDEGILGQGETVEVEDDPKDKKPSRTAEPSESIRMGEDDLSDTPPEPVKPIVKPRTEPRPAAAPVEAPRTRAPMPKPSTPAKPPPGSSPPGRRPGDSRSDGRVGDGQPGDINMADLANSAIARVDDLVMPSDDDEVEATRVRQAPSEPPSDGVPTMKRRPVRDLDASRIVRSTPVSMPAVGARAPGTPERATPASTPARPTPASTPVHPTPASTPVPRTPAGRPAPTTPAPQHAKPIKKAASVDLLEDPETRDLMLGQFWQFEGVNGVAIISSTGKVIAEDMRNNSTVVTLAGFYMRGAARIARTLGYNVFDGVIARAANGQQMIMVGMGATSAVLSVAPGHDPEVIRDAIMGVDSKR
jgi:CheY-like chemotaxis protein/predicted regulator of Ras-like GTPase activity (Roadblock/LC7/MglB family)